jgi:hypothetical protein
LKKIRRWTPPPNPQGPQDKMSTSITITVNKPDDTEMELSAACGSGFDSIARAVEMALEVNGVKEGDWSSLVVTIVPSDAPPKRLRPTFAIVR